MAIENLQNIIDRISGIIDENKDWSNYSDGDVRLAELRKEIIKLKEKQEQKHIDNNTTQEGFWKGNDYY